MKSKLSWVPAVVAAFAICQAHAEGVVIGGVGGVTEAMHLIGATYARSTGVNVSVIPALGTSGGLSAAADGVIQMAVAGRALNSAEEARNLIVAMSVCTPYVFATSLSVPVALERAALPAMFSGRTAVWPDATPARPILRPRSESDNGVMAALFPGMEAAIAEARTRSAIPVAATDQDNAKLAESIPGSLTGTTFTQIVLEKRALRLVAIDGVPPDLAAYESGQYPYGKRLYFVTPRAASPAARGLIEFLNTPIGLGAMRDAGLVPCSWSG